MNRQQNNYKQNYIQQATVLLQESQSAGNLRLRMNGKSMHPLLQPGDILTAKRAAANELKRGEIIIVRDEQGLLTHRLLAIQDNNLFTKGDALCLPDTPQPCTTLIGRVVLAERAPNVKLDFTLHRWQQIQSLLARLYEIEGQLNKRFSNIRESMPTLQKCIIRIITLPLRAIAFLLQWGTGYIHI